MPFFVSVVVLDSDVPCHLAEFPEPSLANRTKSVRISITRGQRYWEYVSPIGTFLVLCALLVLFAFLVMATKRLSGNDEEVDDEIVDEPPSVYNTPKQSKEELEEADPKRRKRRHSQEDEVDAAATEEGGGSGDAGEAVLTVTVAEETEETGGGDSIQPIVEPKGKTCKAPTSTVVLTNILILSYALSGKGEQASLWPEHPRGPEG